MKVRHLTLLLCATILCYIIGCAPWVDQLDRDDPKNDAFFKYYTIYGENLNVNEFEKYIDELGAEAEAEFPKLEDPVVRTEGPEAPETTVAKKEMAFVHLSDVQIRDERVKLFGKGASRTLDKIIPSFEHGIPPAHDQEHYDYAAYLALIKTINACLDDKSMVAAEKPKFMIHTGDAVDASVVEELYEFIYISNKLTMPWFNALGNHDVTVFGNFNNKKVYVNDPSLIFQTLHNKYNFINMHGGGHRVDPNINPGPPSAEHLMACGSLYHGFDLYNTKENWQIAVSKRLESLPQEVEFPEGLKEKISYNPYRKLLSFKGLMAEGVMSEEEKDELLRLSEDDAYKKAVEALFNYSRAAVKGKFLCKDCPGYYSFKLRKVNGDYVFVSPLEENPPPNPQEIVFIVLNTTTTKPDLAFKGTVSEDSQLEWLKDQLEKNKGALILAFGHHPLDSSNFFDESYKNLIDLFHEYNVIAYFCGHTHAHQIRFHEPRRVHGAHEKEGASREPRWVHGFWEVITDSIIEFPQEGSLVTISKLGDGIGAIDVQGFGRNITNDCQLKEESDLAFKDAERDHFREIDKRDRNARLPFHHNYFAD